jgi:hypothetical protein
MAMMITGTLIKIGNTAVVVPVDKYDFGIAIFKNLDSWGYPANEIILSRYGIPYDVYNSTDIGNIDLSKYAKVVIASFQDQDFYDAVNASRAWFEEYVENGGVLEIHAANGGWLGGLWIDLLPGGINYTLSYTDEIDISLRNHPVSRIPNNITEDELDGWLSSAHGYFVPPYPPNYIKILELTTIPRYPVYIEVPYGSGVIIASSQTLEHAYRHGYSFLLENSLLYLAPYEELDMEVSVGSVHFRGEIAEFYIKTSLHGNAINASLWEAMLYYENGTHQVDLLPNVEALTVGLYRITYPIPAYAPTGTYTLLIKTSFRTGMTTATGYTTASFIISPTLTSQYAYITEIKDNIATIVIPNLDTIKVNLTEIDAKVISIEGNIATIETNLGTVKTNVENIEGLIGIVDKTAKNTYMTSLVSTILAAVIAIVIIFIVKKKLT